MVNRDTLAEATLTRVAQKTSVRSSKSFIITIPAARKIMERQPRIMPDKEILLSGVSSGDFLLFIDPTRTAASTRRPPIIALTLKFSFSRIKEKKLHWEDRNIPQWQQGLHPGGLEL